jgi:NAD-dependent DNA ligase
LLTGLGSLDEEDQMTFVRHVIKSDHWAGNRKRKAKVAENGQGKAAKVASKSESASKAAKEKKAASVGAVAANIVPGSFKILVPGVNGALGESFLKGKTFVITGVFPEVGGGDDDCIGVENLKSMIETFGGKVTTRFSKNSSELMWLDLRALIQSLPRIPCYLSRILSFTQFVNLPSCPRIQTFY